MRGEETWTWVQGKGRRRRLPKNRGKAGGVQNPFPHPGVGQQTPITLGAQCERPEPGPAAGDGLGGTGAPGAVGPEVRGVGRGGRTVHPPAPEPTAGLSLFISPGHAQRESDPEFFRLLS